HTLLGWGGAASRARRGGVGPRRAPSRPAPAFDLTPPAITHHRLVLFIRPPKEFDLRYEGVKRHVPPSAGAIMLVPAGCPARWHASGRRDALHIYLEPGLVARGAPAALDLDPARPTGPP